jgi:hypothetical protein
MFRKNIKNLFIYHISKSISPTLTEFMANTKKSIIVFSTIPAPLEDARFRKTERIIIKAHFFVKGHSLKNKCNDEYVLLSFPRRACL